MNNLDDLGKKVFFTLDDIARAFDIQPPSARVLASRYVRRGLLIRFKNNFYTTAWRYDTLTRRELFKIANVLQVPSYISLMTALAYYDVTTQVQQNFYESVCLKRTVSYSVRDSIFQYTKIAGACYGGFVRSDGIFMATPEKAFMDAAYLYSFGKYKFDVASLDMNKLDMKKLKSLLKDYPAKTKETVKRLCAI
jgi:predicted transcriptional regulator of viral defense system